MIHHIAPLRTTIDSSLARRLRGRELGRMGTRREGHPWVPTFDAVVLGMLTMAQVTPEDRLLKR
jgi:hypothetical protein